MRSLTVFHSSCVDFACTLPLIIAHLLSLCVFFSLFQSSHAVFHFPHLVSSMCLNSLCLSCPWANYTVPLLCVIHHSYQYCFLLPFVSISVFRVRYSQFNVFLMSKSPLAFLLMYYYLYTLRAFPSQILLDFPNRSLHSLSLQTQSLLCSIHMRHSLGSSGWPWIYQRNNFMTNIKINP